MSDNLPPLPELRRQMLETPDGRITFDGFTADQMQAYARAAIEADRVSRDVPAGMVLLDRKLAENCLSGMKYAANWERDRDGRPPSQVCCFEIQDLETALAASPQPQPVQAQPSEPIDMVLHCPACGEQHIDAPDEVPGQPILKSASTTEHPHKMMQVGTYTAQGEWTNPPHRSHLCHGCGHIWRPADVPTNGVSAAKTKGKADSPVAQPKPANQQKEPQ